MSSLAAFRSRRNWFALLVLPALLLRALIPVGFMPMVSAGALSIAICPGMADLTALSGHPHGGREPSTPAHHAPCLFAASAGGAPAPAATELTVPVDTPLVADSDHVSKVLLPTILRIQTPRGPPTLS